MTSYSEADIADVINRSRIYDVLTRYCHALDRCDEAAMKSVYWEDGFDDHGVFAGNAQEFASFIISEIQRWFEVTMHSICNVHFKTQTDTKATTETCLLAYHKVRGDVDVVENIFGSRYMQQFDWQLVAGKPHAFFYGGRYLDQHEKRDGIWRIAKRTVIMDWNHNVLSGEILDQGMMATLTIRGGRGAADPGMLIP
jgi:SnoaL-like domain